MAWRDIITVDEAKCDGCGDCVTTCDEAALRLVDGKARLVRSSFCDGFGDCVKECPQGALRIVRREVDEFRLDDVRDHVRSERGEEAVQRLEESQARHATGGQAAGGQAAGGCPGTRVRFEPNLSLDDDSPIRAPARPGAGQAIRSELRQWPIQIHLVPPDAPFLRGRELAVLATCSPVASPDVHSRFVRDRSVLIGCPKLDRTEGYVEKLAAILAEPTIPRVSVVRMTVPCCSGLTAMVREAARRSGREDLVVEEVEVSTDGTILGE